MELDIQIGDEINGYGESVITVLDIKNKKKKFYVHYDGGDPYYLLVDGKDMVKLRKQGCFVLNEYHMRKKYWEQSYLLQLDNDEKTTGWKDSPYFIEEPKKQSTPQWAVPPSVMLVRLLNLIMIIVSIFLTIYISKYIGSTAISVLLIPIYILIGFLVIQYERYYKTTINQLFNFSYIEFRDIGISRIEKYKNKVRHNR